MLEYEYITLIQYSMKLIFESKLVVHAFDMKSPPHLADQVMNMNI